MIMKGSNTMKKQNNTLSLSTKLGYGIASVGDAIVYGILVTFMIYYLTAIAHVDPGTAGTISSIALFISAVTTFFIGYLSDNSKCKTGRRRPYVKVSMPFIFISFIALFSSFGLTGTAATLYYGFFAILLWVSYCTFFVPYTALGAEVTDDYTERTSIRAYAAVGTQTGNFISTVLPLAVVSLFVSAGLNEAGAWSAMSACFVTAAVIFIGLKVKSTKGKELIITHEKNEKRPNLFKDYIEVLRAKPMKFLIMAIICFVLVNSIFAGNLTFFIIYKLEMSEGYVSTIFAVMFLVAIPLAAVINFVAQKFDKRIAFIFFFLLSAILMTVFRFIGVNSIFMLGLLSVGFVIANAGYWQLISATLYDVAEVVELRTGKRLEGVLSSLQSITQQIGASIAMLIMGWYLKINHFDGAAVSQPEDALNSIVTLQTVIPGIILFIGAIFLLLFPITKQKYALIQNALKDKHRTGEYSKEGLERII